MTELLVLASSYGCLLLAANAALLWILRDIHGTLRQIETHLEPEDRMEVGGFTFDADDSDEEISEL